MPLIMSLISWNCRRLENPWTVHHHCHLVKEKKDPVFYFLWKQNFIEVKFHFLRNKLGFDCLFVVNPLGRSGGLALFWQEDVALEIQNYLLRHINAIIKSGNSNSGN